MPSAAHPTRWLVLREKPVDPLARLQESVGLLLVRLAAGEDKHRDPMLHDRVLFEAVVAQTGIDGQENPAARSYLG